MNLIFLGAPGAGKGTQAEVVSEALNIPQISTGNILREAAKNGTEYGLKAKAAFILDGFPRTVPQAEALDAMNIQIDKVVEIDVPDETIKQRVSGRRVCQGCGASYHIQYKPSKVEGICDKCGDKTIIRKDDQPEVVLDRLATYHEKTAPLKDYYEKQGKLVTVEGQEEVADTSKLTLEAVGVK